MKLSELNKKLGDLYLAVEKETDKEKSVEIQQKARALTDIANTFIKSVNATCRAEEFKATKGELPSIKELF